MSAAILFWQRPFTYPCRGFMALETALHSWHSSNGARMVDFGGWDMPVQYTTIVDEHTAVRNDSGIFDIGHMGRLKIHGPDATSFLQMICTNNSANLKPGQVRYNLVCNEKGTILDDILVYQHGSDFLLVVNASNRTKIVSWLLNNVRSLNVKIDDQTLSTSMIAVQGPNAIALAKQVISDDPSKLGYYFSFDSKTMNVPCLISRTGYTGEDGIEIILPKGEEIKVWEKLVAMGCKPCGLGCRDTLRLEAAMPLYGHEIDENTNPLEAGLGWAVKLDKGEFIGRDALVKEKNTPSGRVRVGLELPGKRIPRELYPVTKNGAALGKVTSGTFSPTFNKPIAMAYVPASLSAVGTELDIDIRGKFEPCKVVPLPFYKRKTT